MARLVKPLALLVAAAALAIPAVLPQPSAALAFLPPRPDGQVLDEAALVAIAWTQAPDQDPLAPNATSQVRHLHVGDLPFASVLVHDGELGRQIVIDERTGKAWGNLVPRYQEATGQAIGYPLVQALREGRTGRFDLRVTGLHDLDPPGAGPVTCHDMGVCLFTGSVVTVASLAADPRTATIDLDETTWLECLRVAWRGGQAIPVGWDAGCERPPVGATFRA